MVEDVYIALEERRSRKRNWGYDGNDRLKMKYLVVHLTPQEQHQDSDDSLTWGWSHARKYARLTRKFRRRFGPHWHQSAGTGAWVNKSSTSNPHFLNVQKRKKRES